MANRELQGVNYSVPAYQNAISMTLASFTNTVYSKLGKNAAKHEDAGSPHFSGLAFLS